MAEPEFNDVDRPEHYADGKLEPIFVLEHMLSAEEFRGYLRGTLFYYNWRHGKKDERTVEAGKMRWYAQRLEQLERDLAAAAKQIDMLTGDAPEGMKRVTKVEAKTPGRLFKDPWWNMKHTENK